MESNDKLTQQLDERLIEANLTKAATLAIPNANVMSQSFPAGIRIKDGKPYIGDKRWRMIARPMMEENMPAWREFLGTLRAVAKATDCIDNEDVITISWHYLPNKMPEAGETVTIPFHTVTDKLGAYSVLMEFEFDAARSMATPKNAVSTTVKLYLGYDGPDTASIEANHDNLLWARFHLKPDCDTPLPDPDAGVKKPEAFECHPNLMVVAK